MPPRGVIDKWVVRRNLRDTRDSQGRFVKRTSIAYLIQKAIFERGFKPTYFFTKPLERNLKPFLKDIEKSLVLDYEKTLAQIK